MKKLDLLEIRNYFETLQNNICIALEEEDGHSFFVADNWGKVNSAEGSTRIMCSGTFVERAAINFSHVRGNKLPSAASTRYPELAGASFQALGVSLIIHPLNPYVPTAHANVRFFIAEPKVGPAIWWFGGGYDLTPFYPFEEDCQHWHQTAFNACAPFGPEVYAKFKKWCDNYFFLNHRNETRGVGGLFFDDLNRWSFGKCFNFVQSIGDSFTQAYLPIVRRRKATEYGDRERDFQLYRRGRYVEFNLIQDRGTLFGLQAKGRTESILASMPPQAIWRYNWQPEPNSAEAKLYTDFLQAREWIKVPLAL